YNCTIFAYGQTGTGKTYTMEGSMLQNESDRSSDVGISKGFDPDSGTGGDNSRLRLYDDGAGKGGVVIHGLEEILVRSAGDALKLLQRGSKKRQVASTKCNDFSSRSHSIFMLTVHLKEKVLSHSGEGLIKIGKLNLVDLAGSENIGRSGAENRRAREAGMINQSLLTLGRVINSLVERSPHIPYRESKLTRLLRDSLGGRTRTCLIATISPSKISVEETLSTLDYANRAKNIRNKPQANKKVTQTALVNDLQAEIERLQADLAATHAKNGVYLSAERYQELSEDSEHKKKQSEEWKKRVEMRESELKTVHEEAKKLMKNVSELEEKLKVQIETNVVNQTKIDKLNQNMKLAKQKILEQKFINMVHQQTEEKLESAAQNMTQIIIDTVNDIHLFHEKTSRMGKASVEKRLLLDNLSSKIDIISKSLLSQFSTFSESVDNHTQKIIKEFKSIIEKVFGEKLSGDILSLQNVVEKSIKSSSLDLKNAHLSNRTNFDQILNGISLDIKETSNQLNSIEKELIEKYEESMDGIIEKHLNNKTAVINLLDKFKAETSEMMMKSEKEFGENREFVKNIVGDICGIEQDNSSFIESQKKSIGIIHQKTMKEIKTKNNEILNDIKKKLDDCLQLQSQSLQETISKFMEDFKPVEQKVLKLKNDGTDAISKMKLFSESQTKICNDINSSSVNLKETISSSLQDSNDDLQQTQKEMKNIHIMLSEKSLETKNDLLSLFGQKANKTLETFDNLSETNNTLFDKLGKNYNTSFTKLKSLLENSQETMTNYSKEFLVSNLGLIKDESILLTNEASTKVSDTKNITEQVKKYSESIDSKTAAGNTPTKNKKYFNIEEHGWYKTIPNEDLIAGFTTNVLKKFDTGVDIDNDDNFELAISKDYHDTESNSEWTTKFIKPSIEGLIIDQDIILADDSALELGPEYEIMLSGELDTSLGEKRTLNAIEKIETSRYNINNKLVSVRKRKSSNISTRDFVDFEAYKKIDDESDMSAKSIEQNETGIKTEEDKINSRSYDENSKEKIVKKPKIDHSENLLLQTDSFEISKLEELDPDKEKDVDNYELDVEETEPKKIRTIPKKVRKIKAPSKRTKKQTK
ncbi:hypothetical protein BB558_006034, partial [Smittium angustum]